VKLSARDTGLRECTRGHAFKSKSVPFTAGPNSLSEKIGLMPGMPPSRFDSQQDAGREPLKAIFSM